MDKKTTSIVAYLTLIGLIIAFVAGDKEGAKFHLNQSLVLWIGYLIMMIASKILIFIPILGAIAVFGAYIFLFVMWIMGLIAAINQEEKELPIIGTIKLLK